MGSLKLNRMKELIDFCTFAVVSWLSWQQVEQLAVSRVWWYQNCPCHRKTPPSCQSALLPTNNIRMETSDLKQVIDCDRGLALCNRQVLPRCCYHPKTIFSVPVYSGMWRVFNRTKSRMLTCRVQKLQSAVTGKHHTSMNVLLRMCIMLPGVLCWRSILVYWGTV